MNSLIYLSFRKRPERSEGTRSLIVCIIAIAKTFSHCNGSLVSLGTGSGFVKSFAGNSKIPRGVYPDLSAVPAQAERKGKIPRFARNDKVRDSE
jgi:hypothetical protein